MASVATTAAVDRAWRGAVPTCSLFRLDGQVALVSGACQGLGRRMIQGLAEVGAHVLVHGRQADRAEAVCAELRAEGHAADWCAFDINDDVARAAAFARIEARHGGLDILVNNAGIRARSPLAELGTAQLGAVVQTNLLATIEVTRAAARLMQRRGYGRIVSITSIQGRLLRYGDFIYPVTKQAVETMTRAVAVEYGRDGIRCNAIAPGTFATEFNRELVQRPENLARLAQRNPVGRWGDPAEMIGPAIFLASPAASYVNGQTLVVDGGYSITF